MLTAKDLLYKALDYDGFWNTTKCMKNSKPSQARSLQLEKLFAAFNISANNAKAETQTPYMNSKGHKVTTVYSSSGHLKAMHRLEYLKTLSDFEYFSTGEFIADIDRGKYKSLIKQIIAKANQVFPEHLETVNKEPVNLVRLFSNVYNFRLSIYHMFKFSFDTGIQEKFSIEEDYSLYIRKKFMESANKNLSEIDKLLCMLIDPEKREFNESEISYPGYDFKVLDKEWRDEWH